MVFYLEVLMQTYQHSAAAHVRRIIRKMDLEKREIDNLIPVVKGELKKRGLLEARERLAEVINHLIRAAG